MFNPNSIRKNKELMLIYISKKVVSFKNIKITQDRWNI